MTAHANCTHPATKAARAACRKTRKNIATSNVARVAEIVATYYDNSKDVEDIMDELHRVDPQITKPYYHGDAEVEDIIAAALCYEG